MVLPIRLFLVVFLLGFRLGFRWPQLILYWINSTSIIDSLLLLRISNCASYYLFALPSSTALLQTNHFIAINLHEGAYTSRQLSPNVFGVVLPRRERTGTGQEHQEQEQEQEFASTTGI